MLGHVLRRLDLPVDARESQPHITLARRAGEAALPEQQTLIDWDADNYVLVESEFDTDRTYTILASPNFYSPCARLPKRATGRENSLRAWGCSIKWR